MPIGAWPYDDLPGLVVERLGLDLARVRAAVNTPDRWRDARSGRSTPPRRGSLRGALHVSCSWPVRKRTCAATRLVRRNRAAVVTARRRARPVRRWIRCCNEPQPSASSGPCTCSRSTITRRARTRARAWRMRSRSRVRCGRASRTLRRPIRTPGPGSRSAHDVTEVRPDNRMVSFPYPKSLVANPYVNQGAALLMTDADTARALGIPEEHWVYPLGGAGADECTDPRARTTYDHVPALHVTVRDVQEITGTTADESTSSSCTAASLRCPSSPGARSGATRPRRSR